MSIFNGFQSIRRERAMLERTRVVLTSMMEDAKIGNAFANTVSENYFEGVDDKELEDLIVKIPESDPSDEEKEVNKILMSDNGLDVDGIFDVEDSPSVDDE